jgi:hypothetical protein
MSALGIGVVPFSQVIVLISSPLTETSAFGFILSIASITLFSNLSCYFNYSYIDALAPFGN